MQPQITPMALVSHKQAVEAMDLIQLCLQQTSSTSQSEQMNAQGTLRALKRATASIVAQNKQQKSITSFFSTPKLHTDPPPNVEFVVIRNS